VNNLLVELGSKQLGLIRELKRFPIIWKYIRHG
jgi:hypothetical protein